MPLSLYLVNAVYQSQASLLRSKYQGLKKREERLRDSKGTQHEDRRQTVLQVKHTWSDLYFYRQNDELVLVWGVGFNPDESCVVVRISGREARPHHTLCLKWRYFLQKKNKPWINNSVFIKKKKKKVKHLKLTHNFPVPPCCPVGSSRWRSPPLEYISTTWRRKKKTTLFYKCTKETLS